MFLCEALTMQNYVTFIGAPLAFKLLALHLHGLVEQAVDDGLVTGCHVDDAHAMDREAVQPITCTERSYHTNHPHNAVITQSIHTMQLSHKPSTQRSYHTNHPHNAVITQTIHIMQLSHKPSTQRSYHTNRYSVKL